MSRYELAPYDPQHEVAVGWDAGLGAFFAIVSWVDDRDDEPPLWIGTTPCEIHLPTVAVNAVLPYAPIGSPDDMVLQLRVDKQQEAGTWAHGPAAALLAQPAMLTRMSDDQRARVVNDLRNAGRADLIPEGEGE